MISLQEFINNTNGQTLLYPPNSEEYRGQCVQMVLFYIAQVWGTPLIWKATAAGMLAADGNHYTVTINNPSDPNQIPPVGALIVWNSALPGSGGAGHIAIFLANNGNHTFTSYDSNWGGKTAHKVIHNWNYVAGWVTPKATVTLASAHINNTNTGEEMITTDDQARKVYAMLRPNSGATDGEIQSTTNKRTYAGFMNDAQNEVNQRDQALREQAQHLNDIQNIVNQQNQTIADLKSSNATNKQQYDEALAKIADQNAQLATKHDLLSDLQARINNASTTLVKAQNEAPEDGEVTEQVSDTTHIEAPSWPVRFLMWVFSRHKRA